MFQKKTAESQLANSGGAGTQLPPVPGRSVIGPSQLDGHPRKPVLRRGGGPQEHQAPLRRGLPAQRIQQARHTNKPQGLSTAHGHGKVPLGDKAQENSGAVRSHVRQWAGPQAQGQSREPRRRAPHHQALRPGRSMVLPLFYFLLLFLFPDLAPEGVAVLGFLGPTVEPVPAELQEVLLGWGADRAVRLRAALPEQGQAHPHQGPGEAVQEGQAGLRGQVSLGVPAGSAPGCPGAPTAGPAPGRQLLQ